MIKGMLLLIWSIGLPVVANYYAFKIGILPALTIGICLCALTWTIDKIIEDSRNFVLWSLFIMTPVGVCGILMCMLSIIRLIFGV